MICSDGLMQINILIMRELLVCVVLTAVDFYLWKGLHSFSVGYNIMYMASNRWVRTNPKAEFLYNQYCMGKTLTCLTVHSHPSWGTGASVRGDTGTTIVATKTAHSCNKRGII